MTLTAYADIYEYVDEFGVAHYSDIPDHEHYALVLKTRPLAANNVTSPKKQTKQRAKTEQTAQPPQLLAKIKQSAQNNQIKSELIHAVMQVESAYQARAVSPKGAQGLMQLMPETAKRFGVEDSFDPTQNIEGGARYLKALLNLFNNDLALTLAAYNAGEAAVIKYGNKIPPYKETQAYVSKVLKVYNALLQQSSG